MREEIAKRTVAITAAAAPAAQVPQPVPCATQQPLTAIQLPAILAFLKETLAKAPAAEANLSAPTKVLGQELSAGLQAFEETVAKACLWQAALSQEIDFARGVVSTSVQPDGAVSPERTAQGTTHPLLEQPPPPPLPQLAAPVDNSNLLLIPDGALEAESAGNGETMQMDTTTGSDIAQDAKRKVPYDEDHLKKIMAVARAGKAKGAGKSEAAQAAKRGKTENAEQ